LVLLSHRKRRTPAGQSNGREGKRGVSETPAAYFSESLARGLSVIRAFDRDASVLRITDVAKRTGLSRAAARRYLHTLVDLKYVGCSDDVFYLRPRALEIGFSYLSSLDADHLIQPILNELMRATGNTSSFAVLDNFDVRLVARSANGHMLKFATHVGGLIKPFGTSLGRVLVASMAPDRFDAYLERLPEALPITSMVLSRDDFKRSIEQTRCDGWSVIDQALGEGVTSLAVPISGSDGRTVAAINVLECPPRTDAKSMPRRYLSQLKDAARQIESALATAPHLTAALRSE
jgi:IclR family pca regulon transcriptional regulator